MNPDQKCPRCGQTLPPDAPAGHCPKCLVQLALEAVTVQTATPANVLASASAGVQPPSSAKSRVKYFGDYELIEEIARGGMGVVWKARQASLNRPVALKMILAGQFASETDVRRFHAEAEAAANLQHPNIVAIHEVGEHEGQHYFSMDYIEGKNLAELVRAGPLPAAQAAALVKRIAEAVHFAHQRGTLHRDLKPSNVLIDAEGQPRITDFGLAKRYGVPPSGDSGLQPAKAGTTNELTQTGAVLGTPAYMPPEQASGRKDQVGPASDVYSMGAMLYHLLTGQAPFAGETPAVTMRKVMEEEPVAPSKLNPKTPPDLETICLKCLEKGPERRYHSARELAEELDRFLNHEPILATPASAWRKTWSWLLRHPWLLMGVATFVGLGLVGLAYGLWEQVQYVEWKAAHPGLQFTGRIKSSRQETASTLLFGLGLSVLIFKWRLDLRGQRRNLPSNRLQMTLGVIGGLFCLAGGLVGARLLIRQYVWTNDVQHLGLMLGFGWTPCLVGAMALLQTFRSQQTTFFGSAGEDEGIFLPVYQAPVILNPATTTWAWGAMFGLFGLLAYFALPMWSTELNGNSIGPWRIGPLNASMLIWLRVMFFANAVGTAVLVHVFWTWRVRRAPAWIMMVGGLLLTGDALAKLIVFLPSSVGVESWLAGLAGGLAMAKICKMRPASPADIAAAKALANEEDRQFAAQFGSRTFRVALLGVGVALMLVAFTFFRDQWGVFLALSGLSALQPPLFLAWRAAHKTRLALVFLYIFIWEISFILTGMDVRGPARLIGQELGFADSPPMQFLAALFAGYAAGFVLVKLGRIRPAC